MDLTIYKHTFYYCHNLLSNAYCHVIYWELLSIIPLTNISDWLQVFFKYVLVCFFQMHFNVCEKQWWIQDGWEVCLCLKWWDKGLGKGTWEKGRIKSSGPPWCWGANQFGDNKAQGFLLWQIICIPCRPCILENLKILRAY